VLLGRDLCERTVNGTEEYVRVFVCVCMCVCVYVSVCV